MRPACFVRPEIHQVMRDQRGMRGCRALVGDLILDGALLSDFGGGFNL